MAEEEKEKAEAGTSVLHDVSASAFLLLGMDIQNLQCVSLLSIQLLKPNLTLLSSGKPYVVRHTETLLQKTSLVEWRTLLLK